MILPSLDVRGLPRQESRRLTFATYNGLETGQALLLISDHDPLALREAFETDFPGSHQWDEHELGPTMWRVQITKLVNTALPRLVGNTSILNRSGEAGAVWSLRPEHRDLDSNLIHLPAGERIGEHTGPDRDLLWVVLTGSGTLHTETTPVLLSPGQIIWLPATSRRGVTAGSEGIGYLTVHRRRAKRPLMPITFADDQGQRPQPACED